MDLLLIHLIRPPSSRLRREALTRHTAAHTSPGCRQSPSATLRVRDNQTDREVRERAKEGQYPPGCAVSGGANLYIELLRTPLLGTSEKNGE
jgi:hypothetical protein